MPWNKMGNLKGPGSIIDLGQITLTRRAATVALASGIRTQTIAVAGVLKDDAVHLTPITAPPDGYLVGLPVVKVAGSIDVPIYEAAMILNASYSFKARVLVLRP